MYFSHFAVLAELSLVDIFFSQHPLVVRMFHVVPNPISYETAHFCLFYSFPLFPLRRSLSFPADLGSRGR